MIQLKEKILEPIVNSPNMGAYIAELNRIQKDEEMRRHEFLEWVDEDSKAEFINGGYRALACPFSTCMGQQKIMNAIENYLVSAPQGEVFSEVMVNLNRSNVMPDVAFWRKEKFAPLGNDTVLFPPPDFVVEVLSKSTTRNDREVKMQEYALNGVLEYWIVDSEKCTVEQYILNDGAFVLESKLHDGTVGSFAIEGFTMEVKAIFKM